ncbi:unnamed protein product [Amoebophrya sp. A25]|nr:unnamed protein product [Amoebophrya sp. A25]|eukprot:GSA25T00025542001.1
MYEDNVVAGPRGKDRRSLPGIPDARASPRSTPRSGEGDGSGDGTTTPRGPSLVTSSEPTTAAPSGGHVEGTVVVAAAQAPSNTRSKESAAISYAGGSKENSSKEKLHVPGDEKTRTTQTGRGDQRSKEESRAVSFEVEQPTLLNSRETAPRDRYTFTSAFATFSRPWFLGGNKSTLVHDEAMAKQPSVHQRPSLHMPERNADAFFHDSDVNDPWDEDVQVVGSKVYSRSFTKPKQQQCRIGVTPYQYYGIDPTQEVFSASFKIVLETEVEYEEWVTKVESQKDLVLPVQECLFTTPRFLHKNSIDLQIFSSDWNAKCCKKEVTVTKNQMMTSTCRNDYDLSDFPFDRQTLEIVLFIIPEVNTQFNLDICDTLGKPQLVQSFETNFKTPDWEIIPGSFVVVSDSPPAGQRVVISVQVKRIWQSYIWNFYLVFFLITSSGFASYVWNPRRGLSEEMVARGEWNVQNPHDAITISLLALLTNISFKTYVSQVAPKVGYMTNLDVYIFGCLSISSLQTGTHVIIVLGELSPAVEHFWVVGGMTCLWAIFHLWYFLLVSKSRTRTLPQNHMEPRVTKVASNATVVPFSQRTIEHSVAHYVSTGGIRSQSQLQAQDHRETLVVVGKNTTQVEQAESDNEVPVESVQSDVDKGGGTASATADNPPIRLL